MWFCVPKTSRWFPFSWRVLGNKVNPVFDIKIRITQVLFWDYLLSPDYSCLNREFGLEEPQPDPLCKCDFSSLQWWGAEHNYQIIKHRMGKVCKNIIGVFISTKHSRMQFWAGSWTRWSPGLLSKLNHSMRDVF